MKAIQEHRINCMMLVPTMIYALLDHPRFGEFDLSSLEIVFYGASAISPSRLKEAIKRIGPVFFQFYGQAEAPMAITVLRKFRARRERPAPAGKLRTSRALGARGTAGRRPSPGAGRRARRDLCARARW